MMDFDVWVKASIPKWADELIELGASWDSFRPCIDDYSSAVGCSGTKKTYNDEDGILSDLVKSGIPLLSARVVIAKVKDVLDRSKAPLTVFWDFDSIPIPSPMTDDSDTNETVIEVITRLKHLLSSYGSPITFRGYAENISNAVTDEQRLQLSSQFDFTLIDSSTTVSGMDISTKRIIIDAMKLECSSTVANSLLTICFITADIDFSYLLGTLDRPKLFKIFISASEAIKNIPDSYCSVKMDWENDILSPEQKMLLDVAPDKTKNTSQKSKSKVKLESPPPRQKTSIIKVQESLERPVSTTVHMYVRAYDKEIQKDGKVRTKRGRCMYCKQKKTMHYCNHHRCSSEIRKCWLCISNPQGDPNKTCFALYHDEEGEL